MGLFGRGQATPPDVRLRVDAIERELSKVASQVRQLEVEQMTLHDQVRKWMRRAVAAERRVEESAPAPAEHGASRTAQPAPVDPLLMFNAGLRGARGRIARRKLAALARARAEAGGMHTLDELPTEADVAEAGRVHGGTNGVHP